MQDFSVKPAVITGGASGIGRALGKLFLAKGMNVVLADIEQGALADTVAGGIGPEVMAQRVFDAIVAERFYILSEDAWRESANVRLEDVRLGRNPTFSPPINL